MFELKACFILEREKCFPEECLVFLGTLIKCSNIKNTVMAKFLNAYKSSSSRMVKKQFPEIKQYLWKSAFWTQSYCLISTGGAPLEVVKRYIESQGRK